MKYLNYPVRFIKWLLLKIVIPLVTSTVIAIGIAYFISVKYNVQNPFLSLVTNRPYHVLLAGTGSMYPTLYWDKKQGGPDDYQEAKTQNLERVSPGMVYRVDINPQKVSSGFKSKTGLDLPELSALKFSYPSVGFGDIVSFSSASSTESYIKRAIGLPGDKIVIKDGFVVRNGEVLHEPYTYKPRSTFGGKSIPECKEVTVPEGSIMALGDNRKISMDSRADLGFVKLSTVDFVLPYGKQDALKDTWRKIEETEFGSNVATLNAQDFLQRVNTLRKEQGLKELSIDQKLNEATKARANFILDNDNYTTKDSNGKSFATMEMERADYTNILTAEYLVQGYLEASDLMELRLESKELSALLLEKNYTDVGIAVVNKNVRNCPTQVTVIHFGGYIPATYPEETVKSWKEASERAVESSKTWKEARDNKFYDQDKLNKLLDKYEAIIDIASAIYNKVKNRLWLTDTDNAKIEEYKRQLTQISDLSNELNNTAKEEVEKIKKDNYQKCTSNWQLYVSKKDECKKFLE